MTKLVFVLMVSSGTHLFCSAGGGQCEPQNMSAPTAQAVYDNLDDCKKAGAEYVKDSMNGLKTFSCQPAQNTK